MNLNELCGSGIGGPGIQIASWDVGAFIDCGNAMRSGICENAMVGPTPGIRRVSLVPDEAGEAGSREFIRFYGLWSPFPLDRWRIIVMLLRQVDVKQAMMVVRLATYDTSFLRWAATNLAGRIVMQIRYMVVVLVIAVLIMQGVIGI